MHSLYQTLEILLRFECGSCNLLKNKGLWQEEFLRDFPI